MEVVVIGRPKSLDEHETAMLPQAFRSRPRFFLQQPCKILYRKSSQLWVSKVQLIFPITCEDACLVISLHRNGKAVELPASALYSVMGFYNLLCSFLHWFCICSGCHKDHPDGDHHVPLHTRFHDPNSTQRPDSAVPSAVENTVM